MRGLRELYEVRQLSHSAKTSPNPDPDPDPNPDPDLDLDPDGDPGASNLDDKPDPEA